jgi:hypothetical protein
VSHNGALLSDSNPDKWLESGICERYGVYGRECDDIRSQVDRVGQVHVDLSSISPSHLAIRD